MKHTPTVETVTIVPDDEPGWVTASSGCDHCGRTAPNWPSGLMSIDREDGVFTCDFVLCPDCAVTANFAPHDGLLGLMRQGTTFGFILWLWFDNPSVASPRAHGE